MNMSGQAAKRSRGKIGLLISVAILVLMVASNASAQDEISTEDILERREPAKALDDLEASIHGKVVNSLVDELADADTAKKLKIATALCKTKPWVSEDGNDIQRKIWDQIVGIKAQSELSYQLDCAAVNRSGFYRAKTLTPLFNMRLSYCAGQPLGKVQLDKHEEDMDWFSSTIEEGLESAWKAAGQDQMLYSYFPLRTEFRVAVVRSARAVEFARAKNWELAKKEFQKLSEKMGEELSTLNEGQFANTWGAWRYHNDLVFYRNFYAWLGGADQHNMGRLEDWPQVTNDHVVKAAIGDEVKEQIEKHDRSNDEPYVDWTYIERLLPGAAKDKEECGGWRRRYYDTRDLAGKVARCADEKGRPERYEELRTLDSCILEFEADDWSVQFMTVLERDAKRAMETIRDFVRDISASDAFSQLSEDVQERAREVLRSTYSMPVKGKDYVRIVTKEGLTTEVRNAIEDALAEVDLPWGTKPLFRRPTHF